MKILEIEIGTFLRLKNHNTFALITEIRGEEVTLFYLDLGAWAGAIKGFVSDDEYEVVEDVLLVHPDLKDILTKQNNIVLTAQQNRKAVYFENKRRAQDLTDTYMNIIDSL